MPDVSSKSMNELENTPMERSEVHVGTSEGTASAEREPREETSYNLVTEVPQSVPIIELTGPDPATPEPDQLDIEDSQNYTSKIPKHMRLQIPLRSPSDNIYPIRFPVRATTPTRSADKPRSLKKLPLLQFSDNDTVVQEETNQAKDNPVTEVPQSVPIIELTGPDPATPEPDQLDIEDSQNYTSKIPKHMRLQIPLRSPSDNIYPIRFPVRATTPTRSADKPRSLKKLPLLQFSDNDTVVQEETNQAKDHVAVEYKRDLAEQDRAVDIEVSTLKK